MKIGVFDSGVGGQSFVNAINKALPEYQVLLREDKEHVPYGLRSPDEILNLITPIFQALVNDGCEVIVVACNTVTTTLIQELRDGFDVPLVAVEPMVKTGAELTKTKIIAVCATPTTLASPRYRQLKDMYAYGIKVLEPDCSDWAMMIESDKIDHQKIQDRITDVCKKGADVIVLACTHYHWIEERIKDIAGNDVKVVQPEAAVIAQLKRVLARLV